MYKVKTETYGAMLRRCYSCKSPLYVYGGPGIGKSEIPRQVFSEIAKETNKEFVEWANLDPTQKADCIKNPDNYWVFCDQRVGQMDSTDLRGIPNMVNTEMLETVPFSWVIYFTQQDAHGAVFFDELNLAAPVVAGQAYQIINDRTIADRRLGDDVFVFGAGNRATDKAHVFEMPLPLRDRFNELEVEPSLDGWTQWASGKVNPHFVAFIQWKNSYLYKINDNSANKSSTPRGICRASNLVGDLDITSNEVHQFVSISVGEAFATEFQAYVKHHKSLNWKNIFGNPEVVKDFKIDRLWAIVGGLAEHFNKADMSKKPGRDRFDEVLTVCLEMEPDFAIVALRMMRDTNEKGFMKHLPKSKHFQKIYKEFGKYIKG